MTHATRLAVTARAVRKLVRRMHEAVHLIHLGQISDARAVLAQTVFVLDEAIEALR